MVSAHLQLATVSGLGRRRTVLLLLVHLAAARLDDKEALGVLVALFEHHGASGVLRMFHGVDDVVSRGVVQHREQPRTTSVFGGWGIPTDPHDRSGAGSDVKLASRGYPRCTLNSLGGPKPPYYSTNRQVERRPDARFRTQATTLHYADVTDRR
jgi:hypothetical protein